ncbi:hypothetical protein NVP1238A_15 [Vibrio phage 1.238.A._10N.261.52.F10]|uniref:Coil containing protein n=1 Tax=Vibrio phage 1.238.A._10N.261.52.F10 TaxID=1881231 RepID=A0A2I7RUF7_9CAUD|nr:hypothetical protein KNT79_gp15 [Vibrio phage 1.238.A._10N.261.52.F10]AUR97264.1 hypothetical protein NVP1238A_15 [Vibrio phage 1.238.A._10N.261.52.F10]AUR97358.1 hypothetical protein NVP1238B_16 [Vibrio phage 1.238.B._10N.261.52.F10]
MATIEDLANQVGELTDATTDLLTEVNGQKGRLENLADGAQDSANDAQSHANASAGSAIDSSNYANDSAGSAQQSATSAAEAKTYRDQAEEISGLDTVEEAVDLALDARHFGVLSEAEAEAIRADNNEQFAASGFVHMGLAREDGGSMIRINEGAWSRINEDFPDQLALGYSQTDTGRVGNSKTEQARTIIAGCVSTIQTNAYGGYGYHTVKFPEAPNGTVTYDSATGVITDFTKDVDPKYGDVAADVNEAVARAFEGEVKNGDFRFGDNGDWNVGGNTPPTLTTDGAYFSAIDGTIVPEFSSIIGEAYEVEVNVVPDTPTAGNLGSLSYNSGVRIGYLVEGINKITYTHDALQTSTDLYLQSWVAGLTISNVSIRKVTNEVVTERVDMWGFEQWHEEVTDGEVFDCVQSLATTFGDTDVPTVLSKRPLSYFQVYDGQFEDPSAINDQYRCVDWNTITDVQKVKVAAYLKEKLFVGENGNLVNVRIRQRTIAGAGNGDWYSTNSTATGRMQVTPHIDSRLAPRGARDASNDYHIGFANDCFEGDTTSVGVWKLVVSTQTIDVAYKSECYFLVCGTVPRLNQGAYHPRFNEMGADGFTTGDGQRRAYWYEADLMNTPTAPRDCFVAGSGGYPRPADTFRYGHGFISSGGSGRPDGRFYDAIYAGGVGGCIDMRLSAHDASSTEKASEVRASVENGTYRGIEDLTKTYVLGLGDGAYFYCYGTGTPIRPNGDNSPQLSGGVANWLGATSTDTTYMLQGENRTTQDWLAQGFHCYLKGTGGNEAADATETTQTTEYFFRISGTTSGDLMHLTPMEGYPVRGGTNGTRLILNNCTLTFTVNSWQGDSYGMDTKKSDISVSGEFTQQTLYGDPSTLLQALPDGWYGDWGGLIS